MEKTLNSAEERVLTPAEQKLASAPIGKVLMEYAIPSIVSMVVNAIYNIVDQIFIGNGVGFLGNGATNVVYPITIATMSIGMLLGNGGAAFFSLRLGEKKYDLAKKGVASATITVSIVSVLMAILSYIFLTPICRLFGATDQILPYAIEYGSIVLIGAPFVATIMVLSAFIRADGNPKMAMSSMLIGALMNIVLDPIFIFVFDMGIAGAAWATVISQITGLLIPLAYLPKLKTIKLTKADMKVDFAVLGKICALGLSSFIAQAAMLFLMGLMNNSYVKYGAMTKYGSDIPLTAIGITSKLSQILFAFAMGTSTGSQPIIGYNYGARNIARVKKTFLTATGICASMMLVGMIIFEVFTAPVVRMFGTESELYTEFAIKCIRIFMIALVPNGIQSSIVVFFQAIGKPMRSMILSSLRQIVLLLPAILIMPRLFGLTGLLWASPIADITSFIIAVSFFIYQWKRLERDVLTEK